MTINNNIRCFEIITELKNSLPTIRINNNIRCFEIPFLGKLFDDDIDKQ